MTRAAKTARPNAAGLKIHRPDPEPARRRKAPPSLVIHGRTYKVREIARPARDHGREVSLKLVGRPGTYRVARTKAGALRCSCRAFTMGVFRGETDEEGRRRNEHTGSCKHTEALARYL